MSNKTQFSDYESLSRSKTSRDSSLEVDEEGWSAARPKQRVAEPESVALPVKAKTARRSPAPIRVAPSRPLRKWIRKRGHMGSFLGLALFTILVFFRPYELFTSLSWLSGSALWVALVTLIVYVPTQLELEGTLTQRPREVKVVLLLLVLTLLSVPLALEPLAAWKAFLDYLKVVLIFIVIINVVRTEKRLKTLFVIVLLASCVLSLSALNDYRTGNLVLRGERIAGVIGGLFDNPNDLALHLVTMIPISVTLLLATRALPKKLFYGICALLAAVGVVATFSRGGFLGMMCAGAVLAWRLSRRSKFLIPLVLSALLVLLVLLAPGGYGQRLSTTTDGSAAARTDDLKRSVYIAIRHPLLGVGISNYPLYSNSNHATHNAYTEVASEVGMTAMVLYLIFLIQPIKQLRKILGETAMERRRSRFYYLSVGLEASLIGYMVSSFFASVAFLWYAYYLVGYAICVRQLYEAERADAQTI